MPNVKFIPPIPFNPNIGSSNGSICLNKYGNWKNNKHHIIDMLDYINFLLYNPNPNSCLNRTAGNLYNSSMLNYK